MRRPSSEVRVLGVNAWFDIAQFFTSASRAGGRDEVIVLCSAKAASGQSFDPQPEHTGLRCDRYPKGRSAARGVAQEQRGERQRAQQDNAREGQVSHPPAGADNQALECGGPDHPGDTYCPDATITLPISTQVREYCGRERWRR